MAYTIPNARLIASWSPGDNNLLEHMIFLSNKNNWGIATINHVIGKVIGFSNVGTDKSRLISYVWCNDSNGLIVLKELGIDISPF